MQGAMREPPWRVPRQRQSRRDGGASDETPAKRWLDASWAPTPEGGRPVASAAGRAQKTPEKRARLTSEKPRHISSSVRSPYRTSWGGSRMRSGLLVELFQVQDMSMRVSAGMLTGSLK